MTTTTLGELISRLVDMYERRYEDHELAIIKAALVVDELLRARDRQDAAGAAGAISAVRSGTRHAA